ncbi:MAG: nucleotidyl transferase AbiEii/AbiGii toxin family protein [Candidatus Ancaeobacter aquaticus]|nr:nucleotidyl transferase AbiEii/AbiGii toxin family protein [Candidatus Ancaeobacter aquaticus]
MIHKDKAQFIDVINMTANRTGFRASLIEKDYYLTLILSKINELSQDLIFKGGTCLNKIYYSYYRLSEDLDFSMRLPEYTTTRTNRRKSIQPIKDKIEGFVKRLGFHIKGVEKTGRNESKQYVYYFTYKSVLQPTDQIIKFEIGLRFNPICAVVKMKVQHKFLHPFTGEPLFDGGEVNCLSLKEIVSEKLRAAALRKNIAPRDFYDLDFILRNNFILADKEVIELFKKKIKEDSGDLDLAKYRINLGRSNNEITDMRYRIEKELFDVLTADEREIFDLDKALKRINKEMNKIGTL